MNSEMEQSHKAEHALESSTRINLHLLNDKTLRTRIDSLGEDVRNSREIFKMTKEILTHRDGTFFEDLAFVNTV